ncbi:MAG TPA: hypothetical protein VFG54_12190 [Prolixibacteraceae bacterium]|nr:hypothetical protein [Prolixibacteraceae bacterium]
MKQCKTISGTDALALMRRMSREMRTPFIMHHVTWNEERQETDGMRVVNRCMLRASMRSDIFPRASAELYLAYTDMDLPKGNQNRMCRKKLIRYVAFAPSFEILKVNWF